MNNKIIKSKIIFPTIFFIAFLKSVRSRIYFILWFEFLTKWLPKKTIDWKNIILYDVLYITLYTYYKKYAFVLISHAFKVFRLLFILYLLHVYTIYSYKLIRISLYETSRKNVVRAFNTNFLSSCTLLILGTCIMPNYKFFFLKPSNSS